MRFASFALALLFASPAFGQSFNTVTVAPYVDANGWTVIPLTPITSGTCSAGTANGSCALYVDSTNGVDGTCALVNDGDTSKTCKTLAKLFTLVRSNAADRIYFKKGGSWNENLPANFNKGKSPNEPLAFLSYGTGARPLITYANNDTAFSTAGGQPSSIAIIGLEFYALSQDPLGGSFTNAAPASTAIGFISEVSYWLVEDCKISFYQDNVGASQPSQAISNIIYRRNVIMNAYSSTITVGQGSFIAGPVGSILFEDNYFYHNGWYDGNVVAGSYANVLSHNSYVDIQSTGDITGTYTAPVTYRGNVFVADATGNQGRAGGTWDGNVWWGNPYATNIGIGYNAASFTRNWITRMSDFQCQPQGGCPVSYGKGIDVLTAVTVQAQSTLIDSNIFSHQIGLRSSTGYGVNVGNNSANVTISNNIICDIDHDILIGTGTSNIVQTNNSTNLATCSFNAYPFPNRSPATYDSEVMGGPGTQAHLESLFAARSKDNWDPRLTGKAVDNYGRAGFSLAPVP